jgi:copper chaperone CopZ
LRADPVADCRDVQARAVRKREDVERKIAQLHHMRDALDELIATCPGGGALRSCTIIDALTRRSASKAGQDVPPTSETRHRSPNQRRTAKGRNMKTANFKIEGMHCEGCGQTVKSLVGSMPGVRAADVSFKEGQARILYDPQSVTEAELARTIERGGFRALSSNNNRLRIREFPRLTP